MGTTWVFGYASLFCHESAGVTLGSRYRPEATRIARLLDHERWWGVGLDNAADPRKHYVDATGRRPACHVAYLDVRERRGSSVLGRLLPVDEAALARLRAREARYEAVDVTGRLEGAPPGRVLVFRGLEAERRRQAAAASAGRAVIWSGYWRRVRRAFEAEERLAELLATTQDPPYPLRELEPVLA